MDADRTAQMDRLLDQHEILDCLKRFSRGMDRFDRELFLSAFHLDAVIAAGDFVGGPVDLYDWASAMHEQGQVATQHNLLNNSCEIDGDIVESWEISPDKLTINAKVNPNAAFHPVAPVNGRAVDANDMASRTRVGYIAHTETYYLFVGRNRNETNWIAGGRYFDRLERRGGAWRIAVRTNTIEWSGMVPAMPLPFAEVPDIHGNGVPSRSKADPSYQRPLVNRRARHNPLDT